jgi:hypothetical protein
VTEAIDRIMEKGQQEEFLSPHLTEIIVSDHYTEEWEDIAGRWNLHSHISNEAEYVSSGKLCYNKDLEWPKYIILFHPAVFADGGYADHFYRFMLSIVAKDHLPEELMNCVEYRMDTPFPELIKVFFAGLFDTYYSNIRLDIEGRNETPPPISPKDLLAPFKRRVKQLHWKHQADLDFEACVMGYYRLLLRLLTQIVEASFYKLDLSEFGEFREALSIFLSSLYGESANIIRGEPYSLNFLDQTLIECSRLCFFKITMSPYDIRVADTPKKLFPDLVDTHQRIVAFVDMLGFSEAIRKVDGDNNIVILKELKEALDTAMEEMRKVTKPGDEEVEIRLFSDCLCLSAAYFDNGSDFAYQFSRMMLGLKAYQFFMLKKGYLVRGGVATGSYYSDPNMIFSGALVEAVNFEKYCSTKSGGTAAAGKRSPRILISPKILGKLGQSTIHKVMMPYFRNSLVTDSDDGEIFINPLLDVSNSRLIYDIAAEQLKSLENSAPNLYAATLKNIELLKSRLGNEAEGSVLSMIDSQLNLELEKAWENSGVSAKYEWTKGFVSWQRSGMKPGIFSTFAISFSKVVDD